MSDAALVSIWRSAIRRDEVSHALETIYAELGEEISKRKPRCEASGRCCRFESWGHRLYVTGLEAAYTIERLDQPAPDVVNTGAMSLPVLEESPEPPSVISTCMIDAAEAQGGCPFQLDGLCSVHAIKPLGCRIYFCDPEAQDWQQSLHEELLRGVRAIHEREGIEYLYAEWRAMLRLFCV